jgi:hypothetical protein
MTHLVVFTCGMACGCWLLLGVEWLAKRRRQA